ncbi:MAG: ABC-F family ATP-binding cassette domain-containing protein [archaeon]
MIFINDFTKGFERENLLENINLVIHPDRRIALVGKNGAGKSTFLKCLSGQEDFSGRIISEDVKISMMEQESSFEDLDRTFGDYIEDKARMVEDRKAAMEKKMGSADVYEDEEKMNSLMDRYNLLLAESALDPEDVRLIDILGKLDVGEDVLSQKISSLSGGQKVKLRLAECLARKADIYFLDEPTNHLDLESSEWLGRYVKDNIKSLIVISHDRYFLNEVIDGVWKIEDKKIEKYAGSYSDYEEAEREHLKLLGQKFRDATRRKAKLLESAAEKRRWAGLAGSKRLKCLADRLKREAEEIVIGTNPEDLVIRIEIDFPNKKLHNCEVFRLSGVTKEFDGNVLFDGVDLEIDQGEKIAIVGGNGAGKTTLLKVLMGIEKADSGTVFRRDNLRIGYFDQELSGVGGEKTVAKFIEEECGRDIDILRTTLSQFGFNDKFLVQKIGKLSGGEKGRLNLLRITLEDNEILLLDEPTNNLDIHLKDSLEKAIREFPGTVVVVSHDRYFMDRVATRVLDIGDGEIASYKGNYSEYLESRGSGKS